MDLDYDAFKKRYKDSITLADAESAMDSQSACNGGALIRDLGRRIEAIQSRARAKGFGTDWVNEHPIVTMFLTQLVHLNHKGSISCSTSGGRAYDLAYDLVNEVIQENAELEPSKRAEFGQEK